MVKVRFSPTLKCTKRFTLDKSGKGAYNILMSLTKEYKGSPEIKVGGVHCHCCNDYHSKNNRRKPFRAARRKAKQAVRKEVNENV